QSILKGVETMPRSAVFSGDGKLAIWLESSGDLSIWDAETGKHRANISVKPSSGQFLAASPDGKMIAIGYTDRSVQFIDLVGKKELPAFKCDVEIRCLSFSPDGAFLAIGQEQGLLLHEIATKKQRRLKGELFASQISFSPDGKTVAIIGPSDNRKIEMWD